MVFPFVTFVYLVALVSTGLGIFIAFNTMASISELRTDYINPIHQCRSLNRLILPEYVLHIISTLLFLSSAQIIAFIINLPLVGYHIYTYWRRPLMSSAGIYDPTTIMNRDQLNGIVSASWRKAAFHIISCFCYLFAFLYTWIAASS